MADNDALILQMLKDIQDNQRQARTENAQNFGAVHRQFEAHAQQDVQGFNAIRREITAVRKDVSSIGQRVATLEGQSQGEQRASEEAAMAGFFSTGPNGTGRYPRLQSSHDLSNATPAYGTQVPQNIVVPTPGPGTHVEVRVGPDSNKSAEHESVPPVLSWIARMLRRFIRSTPGKIGGGLALVVAGWVTRHVTAPLFASKPVDAPAVAASAPKPDAFSRSEAPTLPAIPAAMAMDASVQWRDSGPHSH
jgi:hypothetical protein